MQMTARTPEAAAARRNHLLAGILRRNIQLAPYHTDSRNSSVPRPTMTSQARWTMLTWRTVGRSSAGTVSSPCTTVARPVLGSDSHEASPGMGMPPLTVPSSLSRPSSVSGTSLLVVGTSSIAANLTGWLVYTQRASASPTPIWIGVATAATLNAMTNPSRWYRSIRPRSMPVAYTEATRKPPTR